MQLREKQLNLKRNPINPTENYLVSQSNSKYTKILNQLEKFDITHDSIKSLSKKIFDLDTLELLDEKQFATPSQTDFKASESFDNEQGTSLEKYEIDNTNSTWTITDKLLEEYQNALLHKYSSICNRVSGSPIVLQHFFIDVSKN